MINSTLFVERLIITKGNSKVYDELFHKGINVIRGDHSVGKTTILEVLFYALGGEIKKSQWLYPADICDEVFCQVSINGSVFTLNRVIDKGRIPDIRIKKGPYNKEAQSDAWKTYGPRRNEKSDRKSFSQQLFELLGWDTHKSDDHANLTMHQILRFLYVDQETSSYRILRAEDSFGGDSESIRTAISEFLLGLDNLDTHKLRQDLLLAEREFNKIHAQLNAMYKVLGDEASLTLENLREIVLNAVDEIENLSKRTKDMECSEYSSNPITIESNEDYSRAVKKVEEHNNLLNTLKLKERSVSGQITDCNMFSKSLQFRKVSLLESKAAHEEIGSIKYTHCPCCLEPVGEPNGESCYLCGSEKEEAQQQNNYMEILNELDFQLNGNAKVLKEYESELAELGAQIVVTHANLLTAQSELSMLARVVNDDSLELARAFERIGFLKSEIESLNKKIKIINNLDSSKNEKELLNGKISELQTKLEAASNSSLNRRNQVLSQISTHLVKMLNSDLRANGKPYEEVFASSRKNDVEIDFTKDRFLIDERVKFSGSSNYIKKNSFQLSCLLESLSDSTYRLPRFLMIDAIENGGMKEFRSQQFQTKIMDLFKDKDNFQIIFCTSMVLDELNNEKYGVGPFYSSNVINI